MKRAIFILLLLTAIILKSGAQQAVGHIEALINRSDWFALDEICSKKQDKLPSTMQEYLSEVMWNTHFNRPDVAINYLDTLLTYHQEELGLDNVYNLIALKSHLYADQGLYREASENSTHFLDQLAAFNMSKDNFPAHVFLEKYYGEIAFVPKPEVIRPAYDVEIPFSTENNETGKFIYVPVSIHGKTYRFIFNAGAGFTFISEQLAQEMNIYLTDGSVGIKNVKGSLGKSGVVDSMQIGDITLKNIIVFVGKSGEEIDPALQVDAILGLDFLRLMGEMQLLPEKKVIVFPAHKTGFPKTGRNLMIDNNRLYLKGYSGKERLVFRLDAGNMDVSLHFPYYEKNKVMIESKSLKSGISAEKAGVYQLPQIALKIGKKKFKRKNVPVFTQRLSELQQEEEGALGMDFFLRFKAVTLNTNQMFVEIK